MTEHSIDFLDGVYSDEMADKFAILLERTLKNNNLDNLLTNARFVDLGCGSGAVLHFLKQKHRSLEVIGVDRSPRKCYSDVAYITAIIQKTGLPDSSVQVVMLVNMVDYAGISFTAQELFREVDRILAPRGVFMPLEIGRDILTQPFKKASYKMFGYDWYQKNERLQK